MTDTTKNETLATQTMNGLISGTISREIIKEASPSIADAADQITAEQSYLRDNVCWTELQQLHASCVLLMRTHAAHAVAARDKNVLSRVTNIGRFLLCIQALLRHMTLLSRELSDVYKLHRELQGGAKSHEDVMKSIDLYGMYMLFQERHDAILVPTSNILCELVAEAEEKLNDEGLTQVIDNFRENMHNFINGIKPAKEPTITPEQDPKIITDIVIKEEQQ